MPTSTTEDPTEANENAAPELDACPLSDSGQPDRMELSSFGQRYKLYLQRADSRSERETDN